MYVFVDQTMQCMALDGYKNHLSVCLSLCVCIRTNVSSTMPSTIFVQSSSNLEHVSQWHVISEVRWPTSMVPQNRFRGETPAQANGQRSYFLTIDKAIITKLDQNFALNFTQIIKFETKRYLV